MKFLVMGCGSIGQRHISNIRNIDPDATIHAFDLQPERVATAVEKHSAVLVAEKNIDSMRYDCVFVCTPPVSHIPLAKRALKSHSNVFVEKPLSSSAKGIAELNRLVSKMNRLVFVGYNFRFNKGINMIKQLLDSGKLGQPCYLSAYFGQYLPDWRPWQDYKKSYTARKEMGGGIILDGSHEIDYLVWLLGKPLQVQCEFVYSKSLHADTEAIADMLLRFKNNVIGHVHLDFIRREYKRSLEVLCEGGLIQWSLSDDTVKIFDADKKSWRDVRLGENVNDMYMAEISHVLECIERKKRSEIIDIKNGIKTFSISQSARKSGQLGKQIRL